VVLSTKLRRAPGRIAAGAFILNAGLGKLKADEATAKGIHGMASGTYPMLKDVEPKKFIKGLAIGEIALGGALLLPIFPAGLVGLGVVGFAGSLLGTYWRTPGMHEAGDPRPTQAGTPIAKDVWLLALGAGLVIDAVLSEAKITRTEED
jgi:hypothetical protein